jgi:DUF4097 and DUF4098 domain-containing protein YvlB
MIIAASLLLVGLIAFITVMTLNNWDFSILVTDRIVTVTHNIDDDFEDISIFADTADITFKLSDDDNCKVVCNELEKERHWVAVEDNTLVIEHRVQKKWYDYIGIGIGTDEITVYLPSKEYGNLIVDEHTGDVAVPNGLSFENVGISVTTGDITVENISAKELELATTTGDIKILGAKCKGNVNVTVNTGDSELNDVKCANLSSKGTTGDICMTKVVAENYISVKRNTGNVTFDSCDAADINVKTSTGDVKGSFLSEKIFITETNTGKVNLPYSKSGGICEISTDTGDISFEING